MPEDPTLASPLATAADPAAEVIRRVERGQYGTSEVAEPVLTPAEARQRAISTADQLGLRLLLAPREMQRLTHRWRAAGESIGLVPTMGALHEGHLSLVRRAASECRHVVVSVFVNPTQFGQDEDFRRYPRRLHADLERLATVGAEAVFAPDAEAMYPAGHSMRISPGPLGETVEGLSRPGHFQGVATVVAMLLNCARPDRAYFGAKDIQQVAVIGQLVRDLHFDTEIVTCPTVREGDGLAMSSRNEHLSDSERVAATCLWRGLFAARTLFVAGETNAARLRRAIESEIEQEPLAELDYVAVVDPVDFDAVGEARRGTICAVAARVGGTRLIDNIILGGD